MKICITGNSFPVSRNMAYGGERIIYYLVQELVNLGQEVHCVMTRGSDFSGIDIASYTPVDPVDNYDVHFETAKRLGIDFDIYQCNYFGNAWSRETQDTWPYCELTWCMWCHAKWQLEEEPFNVVSYSCRLQADFMERGVLTSMIYYGIPQNLYQFSQGHDGYAVWIGKIEGGKAPETAIKLAHAAGLKLVIMGPPYNTGCFYKQVAPYIDNKKVFWLRGVDDAMKQKVMSRAKVFIYTNDNSWREHFGIVMAESLAMGTPIVGMNRIGHDSSVVTDQIIQDGINGFVLNYRNSNELQEILDTGVPLLNKIDHIDREACRKSFETRFTADLMARRYLWFYDQIAKGEKFGCVEMPF